MQTRSAARSQLGLGTQRQQLAQLGRHAHVARNLQLALHERLLRVQLASEQQHQVLLAQRQRAVRLVERLAGRDAAAAILEIDRPKGLLARLGLDCEQIGALDLGDERGGASGVRGQTLPRKNKESCLGRESNAAVRWNRVHKRT